MEGQQLLAKQWVRDLKTHLSRDKGEGFNAWELEFVKGINPNGPWSEKQLEKIEQILDRVLQDWGEI